MAKETEDKDLNLKDVEDSLDFFFKNTEFGYIIGAIKDNQLVASLMVTFEYNLPKGKLIHWI